MDLTALDNAQKSILRTLVSKALLTLYSYLRLLVAHRRKDMPFSLGLDLDIAVQCCTTEDNTFNS